ncbi:hypothetical protein HOLleu_08098 [Holothuria leucospilota]|uniref:Uncharacterized protein n=1 Tax=Holothuria leucospilota TaxID=206669 RepID=A0A9Q1CIL0_HOLLE|nr:hypothetical protein HOLleu_08098 [Holothuria leucospilota]
MHIIHTIIGYPTTQLLSKTGQHLFKQKPLKFMQVVFGSCQPLSSLNSPFMCSRMLPLPLYSVIHLKTFHSVQAIGMTKSLSLKSSPSQHIRYQSHSKQSKTQFPRETTPDDISVIERLHRLEDSLRYHGYSTIRIALGFAAVIGLSLYLFRDALRDNVADEVSQVASRSLEDEMVIGKVEHFAKSLLQAISNDDGMKKMASDFVAQVIDREESRQAVKVLVINVLNDSNTQKQLGQTFRELIVKAVSDKSTLSALKKALSDILQDETTREAVKDLLKTVFSQEEVVLATSEFFKEVIKSETVVHQATTLGKQVTENVIIDPKIQEATSKTIWKAVKFSVTPRWFGGGASEKTDSKQSEEKTEQHSKTDTSDEEEPWQS